MLHESWQVLCAHLSKGKVPVEVLVPFCEAVSSWSIASIIAKPHIIPLFDHLQRQCFPSLEPSNPMLCPHGQPWHHQRHPLSRQRPNLTQSNHLENIVVLSVDFLQVAGETMVVKGVFEPVVLLRLRDLASDKPSGKKKKNKRKRKRWLRKHL